MNKKQSLGFSLLEIMIVIAIVAILVMIALPSKVGEVTQQKLVEAVEMVEPYKPQIAAFYRSNAGRFPADNEEAGLPRPNEILGNYVKRVEYSDGVFNIYLGQKIASNLRNRIISIRAIYVDGSPQSPVSWICGYNEAPAGMKAAGNNNTNVELAFLPGRCR